MASADTDLCAYCGQHALTGAEEPEHIIPAAINGRYVTKAACEPCNHDAGRDIDQLWLSDSLVLDRRFSARIPDRRGRLLDSTPMLTGMTDDGRRVSLSPKGVPRLVNSPVHTDEQTGDVTITGASQEAVDAQLAKLLRKPQHRGKTVSVVSREEVRDRPTVHVTTLTNPGTWYRESAKVALGLLAEQQPASWRAGVSAQRLRDAMRTKLTAEQVPLRDATSVRSFADMPATAAVLQGPVILISLLGEFAIPFLLESDLDRTDWAWVSDPIEPAHSVAGPLDEVIYARHKALGLL